MAEPTPDAQSEPRVVTEAAVGARVRRSPRYAVFLVLGAALGVLTAMILTFAFFDERKQAANGAVYTAGQVFGFLALVGIAAGLLVGGLVAILLDRTVGRRTRTVVVDHEAVTGAD